jgi:hypothetical protein
MARLQALASTLNRRFLRSQADLAECLSEARVQAEIIQPRLMPKVNKVVTPVLHGLIQPAEGLILIA